MAYAPTAFFAPRDLVSAPPKAKSGPGLLRRLLKAMVDARMRQADREIARYLASTGGRFTDATEREIERRYLSTPCGW
jgi:hypothetical protein